MSSIMVMRLGAEEELLLLLWLDAIVLLALLILSRLEVTLLCANLM